MPTSYTPISSGSDEGTETADIGASHTTPTSTSEKRPGFSSRFPLLNVEGQDELAHKFDRYTQFWSLFWPMFLRFVMNVVFCGLIIGLFIYYQHSGVISRGEKEVFNAGYIGLSLVLGLNLIAAFKQMADMMRWRVLANGPHSATETELILSMSSFMIVSELTYLWLFKSPRHIRAGIAMSLWVSLGIAAQVALALLGLMYSQDSSDGSRLAVKYHPGQVNVTDFSHYFPIFATESESTDPPKGYMEDYMAHLWGDMSAVVNYSSKYDSSSNTFEYNFVESLYTPDLTVSTLSYISNRSVTVKPKCDWYPIIDGQTGNGSQILIESGTNGAPYDASGWLLPVTQSTVFYNMINNESVYEACGDRCASLQIARFLSVEEVDQDPMPFGDYYYCTVDVSPVANAYLPEHEMNDTFAQRAAGSIGLTGILDSNSYQYNAYTIASYWGNWDGETMGNGSEGLVAARIGQFATGSIATLDSLGTQQVKEVLGMRPSTGVFLTVKWFYVWLTLGLILGVNLVCGLIAVIISNTVFVKDGSHLATAQLLKPLVERLGPLAGSAASGKDIAKSYAGNHLRYGVTTTKEGIDGEQMYHLQIGFKQELPRLKTFPEGNYK